MSVLTLVRHGQASFFSDNYDQLSTTGEQQARRLGQYWAQQAMTIDQVFTGPRARQRRSAELAAAEFQRIGMSWPEIIEVPELDEYDLDGLLKRYSPRLAARDSEFAQLLEQTQQSDPENRMRSFQLMFESLLLNWQNEEAPEHDLESWAAFRERVQRFIQTVQSQPGRGRRTIAFTSGGFISGALQQALHVSNQVTLAMNWRIRNASFTDFVMTRDRFSLDAFNAVPHLTEASLLTYR